MADLALRDAADNLRAGIAALGCLRDLLAEYGGRNYHRIAPSEGLAELTDMVTARIEAAALTLGYLD